MLDGFDVARGNYHNFANGFGGVPMVGFMADVDTPAPEELECRAHPMNYVIRLTGDLALSSQRKVVEVLAHGTVNPWGHDWDEHGNCFLLIP